MSKPITSYFKPTQKLAIASGDDVVPSSVQKPTTASGDGVAINLASLEIKMFDLETINKTVSLFSMSLTVSRFPFPSPLLLPLSCLTLPPPPYLFPFLVNPMRLLTFQ